MKISYRWLLELTGLDWPVEQVADRLTLCGTACEDITPTARFMKGVVVGEVLDVQAVPGADKIRRATVTTGKETLSLVCGAPNVAVGQKVPVATLGAELSGGLVIKKATIRGIESSAMICSQAELGISDDHSGIWVLEPDLAVGRPLAEALDFDDYTLDFELTPNRADSMSAIGIARDLAALAGVKIKYPTFEIREGGGKSSDYIGVQIDAPDACGRFTARIIQGVTVGPSPWWMQKRLIAAGMRPISNIVDITNFVMLETGNPMHAFDYDRFGSKTVVVRRARDGESFVTLDGKKHELISDNLMITNGSESTGVGGVMGGLNSEVSDDTSTIMLEVAYFEPSIIRRSRRHLGLVTEASQRFEKGVDPNNVIYAGNRAAYLFQELCGGKVLGGVVDSYPRPVAPVEVTLRPSRCRQITGADFSTKRMKEILTHLEIEVTGDEPITATVPTFRHDITREIDLIEEIARIEGYNAIPDAVTNIGPLFTPTHAGDRFVEEIRGLMTGAGFDEMIGHGLADSKAAARLHPDIPQLRIINPVSEDLDIMRNSLMLSALPVAAHNIAHRNVDLQMFEIGKAYFPPDGSGRWVEAERLCLMVTGQTPGNWRAKARPYDFYDLTGALETLGRHFRWPAISYRPVEKSYFETGHGFAVTVGKVEAGEVGALSDAVTRYFDVKQRVFLAELDLAALLSVSGGQATFEPLPTFPAAPRDIAMIVDEGVQVGRIVGEIKAVAGDLAESVELFDLYTGKQIPAGKKSIAIALVYRLRDRSLSSEEVESRQQAVIAALKQKFNAEIRDK
ncbi:MAG: phenylalanine--tRNA ligase subunit beta [candidate division Zixibacteria bacterium]|jgi:phenylalanyl-tRNA synthetase beta chain|nr:phenylalanine--tRNA ligase subunit beta [candidate division Zixibacteria bacterium]